MLKVDIIIEEIFLKFWQIPPLCQILATPLQPPHPPPNFADFDVIT